MKVVSMFSVILLMTLSSYASQKDSLIFEIEEARCYVNTKTGLYTLESKTEGKKYRKLKYVNVFHSGVQILDKNNEIVYMNESFELVDSLRLETWLCGTVPHYSLTIEETGSSFQVFSDEYFYDTEDIPPAMTMEISKDAADSICFINLRREFIYTSNYGAVDLYSASPTTVLLMKDGKYATSDNRTAWYDAIAPDRERSYLVSEKNGLKGIVGLTEPIYKEVYPFEWGLALVQLPNGDYHYVDSEGKVY